MQKLLLLALLAVTLTGCIGRTITYEPDFSQRTQIASKPAANVSGSKGYTGFILSRNPRIDKNLADNIAAYVSKYSTEYEFDPRLVLAVIAIESSFRPNAVSSSGAIGLGQLLKGTAKDMGIDDPFDPEENVKATTKFLAKLSRQWNGNLERTLASYKTGAGTVTRLVNSNQDFPDSTKKYISDVQLLQAKISE